MNTEQKAREWVKDAEMCLLKGIELEAEKIITAMLAAAPKGVVNEQE